MLQCTRAILEELEAIVIDGAMEPSMDIVEGDHVLGIMSPELQKLFCLAGHYDDVALAAKQCLISFVGEELAIKTAEYNRLEIRAILLDDLLVLETFEEFGLWDKPVWAYKKGWQVIWRENPPSRATPSGGTSATANSRTLDDSPPPTGTKLN